MKIKGIFKAIIQVSFIGALTRLFAFVFRVYLSRRLGAEILGLYQVTTSIFMLFLCVTTSGLPTTLSRKTAQYETISDYDHSRKIFSMAMVTAVIISVFFCLLFVVCPKILDLLFVDDRCKIIFKVLLPSLVSSTVYCIIRAWFWGKKQFFIYSITEFLEELLKIILTATLISLPFFADKLGIGVAAAYVIGDIAITCLLIWLYLRKGGTFNKPLYFKELMKSATPLTGTRIYGSLLSSALALVLPALLVKIGMDSQEAMREFGRISGMVMPIVLAPGAIVGALAVVMVPELASVNNCKDYSSTFSKIKRGILLTAVVTAICLSAFMSSGKEIGLLLYNDARAGELLKSSCVLMVPLILNQFTATALNSLAQEKWTFLSHIIGSVALLILLAVLPRYVGIMAYTYSLLGFHTICFTLNTIRLKILTKINLSYLLDCAILLFGGFLSSLVGSQVSAACTNMSLMLNILCSCATSCGLLTIAIALVYFCIYKREIKSSLPLKRAKHQALHD